MIEAKLVPGKTVVTAKGEGAAVDVSAANSRAFLLTLDIMRIVEQEALEISIAGSADGVAWDAKPVTTFPQQFYCGQYPFLLDLTEHPTVKFLRAHWEVGRWGRGTETPMFEFGLTLKEIPSQILSEARAEAKTFA